MKLVLIVDDEQSFVLALELALSGSGFKTVAAYSGQEALQMARAHKPDLILLDYMMPGLNGLETLAQLKQDSALSHIPVILMSGARPFIRDKNREWIDFLFKPFTLDKLLAAVKSAIG